MGKQKNEAVIVDSHLKQRGRFRFAHNRDSYDKLYAWLIRSVGSDQAALVGMEPTNDYWEWLAAKQEALVNCPKRPRKRMEAIGILMNKLLHLIWAVCRQ